MKKRKKPKYWENRNNRINAIRDLIKKLNKNPGEITAKDFKENGLNVGRKVIQTNNGLSSRP